MGKITTEQYLAYLPYGLRGVNIAFNSILNIKAVYDDLCVISSYNHIKNTPVPLKNIKPILRPISDLLKGDLEYLVHHHSTDWFADTNNENIINRHIKTDTLHYFIEFLPFGLIQWLLENHYDIYGLIEQGLAIDINTLNE